MPGSDLQAGIWAARIGPGAHFDLPGVDPPNNIPKQKFDYFHELVVHEEISRMGTPGAQTIPTHPILLTSLAPTTACHVSRSVAGTQLVRLPSICCGNAHHNDPAKN